MVFVRGDHPSVQAVKSILADFASVSGLDANPEKTEIYFGGVDSEVKALIKQSTGFHEGCFPFRYLGIPLHSSKIKAEHYLAFKNKIVALLQHWAVKNFSYAGKIQLLNSVIFGLES